MAPRLVLALAITAVSVSAQGSFPPAAGTPGVDGEVRTVEGHLLHGGSGTPKPVAGQYVVLHRISADSAGPLDSMRTAADGSYRFRYRLEGTNSMYIISSRYAGVAYFTAPLRERDVRAPDGDVLVYDTTSRRFPLTLKGRHFVVSPPDESGFRRVVDVFELSNDSARTLVAAGGSDATWSVRIPDGVRDPQPGGGDLPPDAFRFVGNVASIDVPFPPGPRQLVLTYAVPVGQALTVPVDAATATLEVLVEGAGVEASGASLASADPVSLQGRTFQRYLGGPVPAGASFTLQVGDDGTGGVGDKVVLLILAAAALGAGIFFGRRVASGGEPTAAAPATAVGEAEAIARAIVALDVTYRHPSRQDDLSQAAYHQRRTALRDRLVASLAVESEDDAQ